MIISRNINVLPTKANSLGRLFLLFVCFLSVACGNDGYSPREGDLVFVAEGDGEFSSAVSLATAVAGSVSYVHVGIVAIEAGQAFVLEATGRAGVVLTPWQDFLDAAPKIGDRPGVTVMRVRGRFRAADCIARAREHLGEPYDWYYSPDNGRMYCSELVYDSYLDPRGEHIFSAVPMNFRDPEGNMPEFWTRLFASIGKPVPEGRSGTNPNDMARDPVLIQVYSFFNFK